MKTFISILLASLLLYSCGGTEGADPAEFEYEASQPLNFAEGEVFESPIGPVQRWKESGFASVMLLGMEGRRY